MPGLIWVSPSGDYAIVNSNHIPDGAQCVLHAIPFDRAIVRSVAQHSFLRRILSAGYRLPRPSFPRRAKGGFQLISWVRPSIRAWRLPRCPLPFSAAQPCCWGPSNAAALSRSRRSWSAGCCLTHAYFLSGAYIQKPEKQTL